jgi:hypothetical protein
VVALAVVLDMAQLEGREQQVKATLAVMVEVVLEIFLLAVVVVQEVLVLLVAAQQLVVMAALVFHQAFQEAQLQGLVVVVVELLVAVH